MNLKKILSLIFIIFAIACQKNKPDILEKPKVIIEDNKIATKTFVDHFGNIRDSVDRIIVKLYNLDNSKSTLQDLSKVVWSKSISDSQKLKKFDQLFDSVKNGGYSCCEKTHYKIFFYKNEKEIMTYNIDTISKKNEVLFFDESYQTSYLVNKEIWNNFINKS